MSEQAPTKLSAEIVRGIAHEIVGVPLSDAEVAGFLPLLTAVLAEIAAVQRIDCSGLEPGIRFVLEEWQP